MKQHVIYLHGESGRTVTTEALAETNYDLSARDKNAIRNAQRIFLRLRTADTTSPNYSIVALAASWDGTNYHNVQNLSFVVSGDQNADLVEITGLAGTPPTDMRLVAGVTTALDGDLVADLLIQEG